MQNQFIIINNKKKYIIYACNTGNNGDGCDIKFKCNHCESNTWCTVKRFINYFWTKELKNKEDNHQNRDYIYNIFWVINVIIQNVKIM